MRLNHLALNRMATPTWASQRCSPLVRSSLTPSTWIHLGLLLVGLLLAPTAGFAQNVSLGDPITETPAPADELQEDIYAAVRLAMADGLYQDALRRLDRVEATSDDDRAEGHYLRARIYFEGPNPDPRTVGRELDRALELRPKHVPYMVARIISLQQDSWSFLADKIREERRVQYARDILELDSLNVYAHEELGNLYIKDFWRYRNAISFPNLSYNRNTGLAQRDNPEIDNMDDFTGLDGGVDQGLSIALSPEVRTIGNAVGLFDVMDVFQADQFDLEALKASGVPVVEYARRAEEAYDVAIGHLKTAQRSDPRRRSVYDKLMEIYALKGEYTDALATLDDMYLFYSEDPWFWLYLGYMSYRNDQVEQASEAYRAAERFMDDDLRTAFEDIRLLLSADEQALYDADPIAYRAQYWLSKDPLFLTDYNERRLEHYTRMVYAELLYKAPTVDLRGWETQRGQIILRYGRPKSDVVLINQDNSGLRNRGMMDALDPAIQSALNNSGDSQMRNVAAEGTGFDLVASGRLVNVWDYEGFRFVFEDVYRNGEFELYSPSAEELAGGLVDPWLNDYVSRAEATIRETPDQYLYEPPGRRVQMPFRTSVFRGVGGQSELYVHYGLPITQYEASEPFINIQATIGMFVVGDDRTLLTENRRSVFGLRTSQIIPFEGINLWVDTRSVSVPPGDHEVSIEFQTASTSTVAVQRRGVTAPDFSRDAGLAVSDLMVAYMIEERYADDPVREGEFVRGDLAIQPAPWSVFQTVRPIYLYFEVYNLEAGPNGLANYEIEAILRPKEEGSGIGRAVSALFGGRNRGVSVQLPVQISAQDDQQYLILDATNQAPGVYELSLRVRNTATREEVTRAQDLYLID